MKYVLLSHPTTGEQLIEVALSPRSHREMALAPCAAGFVVRSAGFLRVVASGHFEAFGESVSLRVASQPDDSRIFNFLHQATLRTAPVEPAQVPGSKL